jgi:hypothetical protein
MTITTPTEPTPPRAGTDAARGPSWLLAVFLAGIIATPVGVLVAWVGLRPMAVKPAPVQAQTQASGHIAPPAAPVESATAPQGVVATPPLPGVDPGTPRADGTIQCVKIAGPLGRANPFAPFWKDVPATEVALMPQQITMPTLDKLVVPSLVVQAARDHASLAWRLSWFDGAPNGNVDTNRFCDAVAIEFPLIPGSGVMMGFGGGRVQIVHWKALWQRDADLGFQDVHDLHPNMWSDLYWFAEGERPQSVRGGSFNDPRSHLWFIAKSAGNPMAVFSREAPVEECVAQGFGTLTTQPSSAHTANGAWVSGAWSVVLQRPIASDDPDDYPIPTTGEGQIAFAVWQGSDGNVGGRKQWSNWTQFAVTP